MAARDALRLRARAHAVMRLQAGRKRGCRRVAVSRHLAAQLPAKSLRLALQLGQRCLRESALLFGGSRHATKLAALRLHPAANIPEWTTIGDRTGMVA